MSRQKKAALHATNIGWHQVVWKAAGKREFTGSPISTTNSITKAAGRQEAKTELRLYESVLSRRLSLKK